MKNNDIILIGYSGHAYVVIDALYANDYNIIGYCDNEEKPYNPFELKYLGQESEEILQDNQWIIGIGDNAIREKIYYKYQHVGTPGYVIYNESDQGLMSAIGAGTYVGAGAVLNTLAEVGIGSIVNTGAIVEHECQIGNFVHIAPGAVLAGNVTVGDRTFIGANAVVKQGVSIGRDVIVGAGTVVLNDIPEGVTVVGNPGNILTK